jgi:hypothetical protein
MVLSFFFLTELFLVVAHLEAGEEPSKVKVLRLIQIRLATSSLAKVPPNCQDQGHRVLTTNEHE